MGQFIDLTGETFGRLTVVSRGENKYYQGTSRVFMQVTWNCVCECGSEHIVRASDLKSGRIRSCGCLHDELSATRLGEAMINRTGPLNSNWFGTEVSYLGAHARIWNSRGKAKTYLCVDCDQLADEWSYEGRCPDEKVGSSRGVNNVRYCPLGHEHLTCYSPRCKSCHRRFDGLDEGVRSA